MSEPGMEELLSKVKNRYGLVMLASKRVRELVNGAAPLVKVDSKNPIIIALAEIAAGKIKISEGKGEASSQYNGKLPWERTSTGNGR